MAAYNVVLEYTRGDRRQARYILLALLEALDAPQESIEAAVAALERGDPGPIAELLRSHAGRR